MLQQSKDANHSTQYGCIMTTKNFTIEDFNIETLNDFNIEIGITEKVLLLACKHYMNVSSISASDLVSEIYDLSTQVSDSFSLSSQHMLEHLSIK